MTQSSRRFVLVSAVVLTLVAGWGQRAWTQGALDPSGDERLRSALTPLDRQILEFVNDSQLEQLLNGTDPAEIYLSNGETLNALAARTQDSSSRNLLFAPVRACRLLDTRLAAGGSLRPGETRGFAIRERDGGYSAQGGDAAGCGLPGLAGVTLKTNTVRAVALNVMTVDVGGPGSLAIWPANRSEPEIGSVSFAGALAGGGMTGGVLVPVCDEAGLEPCKSGDLKIKAKISGAHVVADVVGYFHTAGARLAEINTLAAAEDDANGATDEFDRPGEATASPNVPSSRSMTPAPTPTRSSISQQSSAPAPLKVQPEGPPPPYPILPNPFGGNAKIRTAVSTGDAAQNVQQAIDAHLDNQGFVFYYSAIRATATTGNAFRGIANNGRAVYGQTQDGYAIYGFDGGSTQNRGYAGYFYSTNGIGVYGYSNANRESQNIYAPGVYGQSNQGVGVYGRGDTSNSHNHFNEGGRFEGGRGIYARGTDTEAGGAQGYGATIYSTHYRGLYVSSDSDDYSGVFSGGTGIWVNGTVYSISAGQSLVMNAGATAIEPGDLVALAGVAATPEYGTPILAVAKVDSANRHAVVGVAAESISAETLVSPEDGRESIDFSTAPGAAPPNGYLTIVTKGLAPAVKTSSLGVMSGLHIGDKIALSATGSMELATGKSDTVTIGRVVAPVDAASGTVAVLIDIN